MSLLALELLNSEPQPRAPWEVPGGIYEMWDSVIRSRSDGHMWTSPDAAVSYQLAPRFSTMDYLFMVRAVVGGQFISASITASWETLEAVEHPHDVVAALYHKLNAQITDAVEAEQAWRDECAAFDNLSHRDGLLKSNGRMLS